MNPEQSPNLSELATEDSKIATEASKVAIDPLPEDLSDSKWPRLRRLHVAAIWVGTYRGKTYGNTKLTLFDDYYDALTKSDQVECDYSLPWASESHQYFWHQYLGIQREKFYKKDIDFRAAAKRLIPLKTTLEPRADNNSDLRISAYSYPYGLGVIASLDLTFPETIPLDKLLLHNLNKEVKRTLEAGKATLARLQAFSGCLARNFQTHRHPKTIVTVTDGETWSRPVSKSPELRSALDGLCRLEQLKDWRPNPSRSGDLSKMLVRVRNYNQPCRALYAGTDYARVLWFPDLFHGGRRRRWRLWLYHRNLTLATLQTSSLLAFADQLGREKDFKSCARSMRLCSELAQSALKRLFYDQTSSYHTYNAAYQIKDHMTAKNGSVNKPWPHGLGCP